MNYGVYLSWLSCLTNRFNGRRFAPPLIATACVPGMHHNREVKVLSGPRQVGTRIRRQLRRREASWGGSWRRSPGSRNTNRIRPQRQGESARDDEARYLSGRRLGQCGGRGTKVLVLTRGGLPACPLGLPARQRVGMREQESAEVVVGPLARAEGPNESFGRSPEAR